jgi:hypothetical protein
VAQPLHIQYNDSPDDIAIGALVVDNLVAIGIEAKEEMAVPIGWGNGDYVYDDLVAGLDQGVTGLAAWEGVGHCP